MTALSPPRWPAEAPLLREVLKAARRKHWSRAFGDGASEHLAEGVSIVAEWDQDGSLITLERYPSGGLVLDICGVVRMDAVSLEFAVDVLVASGALPATLSSAYRTGYDQGATDASQLPQENSVGYRLERLAVDSDAHGRIGKRLDGLLDKVPAVRRRQIRDVIASVGNELEVA